MISDSKEKIGDNKRIDSELFDGCIERATWKRGSRRSILISCLPGTQHHVIARCYVMVNGTKDMSRLLYMEEDRQLEPCHRRHYCRLLPSRRRRLSSPWVESNKWYHIVLYETCTLLLCNNHLFMFKNVCKNARQQNWSQLITLVINRDHLHYLYFQNYFCSMLAWNEMRASVCA